jgi:aldose 1-epimerase
VEQWTLANARGAMAQVLTYGAVLRSLHIPDRVGRLHDLVLGYEELQGYLEDRFFMGAVVGRYANRIRAGRFTLGGEEYELPLNDGANHLHGGPRGFHRAVWTAAAVPAAESPAGPAVVLRHISLAGDQGYPGTLAVWVTYTLTDDNDLIVDYRATTDRATPLNLTQHSYFNLAGAGAGDVLDHELMVCADHYTPIGADSIPTGEIAPVRGTPFDLSTPRRIGTRIRARHPELRGVGGYDHNYILRGGTHSPGGEDDSVVDPAGSIRVAARLREPESGRSLEVLTTEPGVQLWTSEHVDGRRGEGGMGDGA